MRVIPVDPVHPREDRLALAVEVLRGGGLVGLPTETFYGLAADAFDREAVGRLNRLKGKAPDAPVLLLLAETAQVAAVADRVPELFHALAEHFWPGPLTLVIPASSDVPETVTGGTGTVAVRVPGLALPRRLARALGRPISGPSANRHGEPPARTGAEVASIFGDALSLILDGGSTAAGAPSTILDLSGPEPVVRREGVLPTASLHPFLPASRRR